MKDIVEELGQHAGILWKKPDTHGPLIKYKLMEMTRLKNFEFYAAVGWLALENKIYKNGKVYKLGETNLIDEIGRDAGKLWNILKTSDEADTLYITKLTVMNKEATYRALGWLAREDKIKLERMKPIEPQIKFKLK